MATSQWNWTVSGKRAVSVMEFGAQPNVASRVPLEVMRDAWDAHLRPTQHSECVLQSIVWLGPTPLELTVGLAGSLSGAPASPNNCHLINKNAAAGRRGRWYLPGIVEASINADGSIPSNYIIGTNDRLDDFLAKIETDGIELRILRVDESYDTITSMNLQSIVGVQRRRLRN